uniref:Uncharacterized protein n=1 Tax=Podoviridae sp. ct8Lf7 TaxID=2827723 RepID=A0A8S5S104_9CAUD|nr:MAG TPA: hypothetical protein [Podoviridae sp. ct8Lf7]
MVGTHLSSPPLSNSSTTLVITGDQATEESSILFVFTFIDCYITLPVL